MNEEFTVDLGQFQVLNLKPNYNMTFHNASGVIGTLDFNGPELVFTGNAEESAKVFIDWIAQTFHGRIKEAELRGREAMRKECVTRLIARANQLNMGSTQRAVSHCVDLLEGLK